MKKLLLLRHAKSDWDAAYAADRDRPLSQRGREDAKRVGRFMGNPQLYPDLVLVSPALRAASTVELARQAGNWKSTVRTIDKIYGASPNELLEVVQRQDDEVKRIMLVGHNPTFEDSLSRFVGGGKFRMPTAALALVEWPVLSWSGITTGTGILRWLVKPKLLKKAGWE